MLLNTREALQHALASAYEGNTATANFLSYLCPIDKSPGSPGYAIAMAVQSAKIRAAINDQPSPISDLLLYCYAPDVEAINKTVKRLKIAKSIIDDVFHGKHGYKKSDRLAVIAYIAVDDYRIGLTMGHVLPPAAYTEAAGIPPANWARDWEKHRRAAVARIQSMDNAGVARVSQTCRAIREAERGSK